MHECPWIWTRVRDQWAGWHLNAGTYGFSPSRKREILLGLGCPLDELEERAIDLALDFERMEKGQ